MNTKSNEMTIPAGLKAGDTFKHAGRELVVIKIPESGELTAMEMIHSINTADIDPHPLNRKWFSVEGMKDLVDSIRAVGQTTPGIARRKPNGRLEQVAGERRWKACGEIGIPMQNMIREMTDAEAVEVLLIENAKREGLRPVDEAEIYDAMLKLLDEKGNKIFSLERIAERVHGEASRANVMRVSRMHKLLQLPASAAQALNDGDDKLCLRKAFLVARIADPADREKAAVEVMKQNQWSGKTMTVNEADDHIRRTYQVSLKGWGDHMTRTDLLNPAQEVELGFTGKKGQPGDGSCAKCPWLAKNNPAFADCMSSSGGKKDAAGDTGIEPNTCTRARCHAMKLENLWQKEGAEFQLKHSKAQRVLTMAESKGNEYVPLKHKPSGQDTGKWDDKPTWEKLIKGQDVPLLVGRSYEGTPCLMVHKKTALAAARVTHPEIFAKQEINTADMSAEEKKKHAEDEKKRKAKEALNTKIKEEVKRASLLALHSCVATKGLGLDGRKALALAVGRELSITQVIEALTGQEVLGSDEKALEKFLSGKTQQEVDAFTVMLAIWEDVNYSTLDDADDFKAIAEALGLNLKEVANGVKEKLTAEAKAKADEEKQAQAAKDRKPAKNSSDPTDVSTDKEASKTKAADARSKLGMWSVEESPKENGFFHCDRCGTVCQVPYTEVNDVTALKDGFFHCFNCAEDLGVDDGPDGQMSYLPVAPILQEEFETWRPQLANVEVVEVNLPGGSIESVMPIEVIDLSKVDIAAGAEALRLDNKTITDLIGPKPHAQKDGDRYRTWNSLRMKLLRAADLAV